MHAARLLGLMAGSPEAARARWAQEFGVVLCSGESERALLASAPWRALDADAGGAASELLRAAAAETNVIVAQQHAAASFALILEIVLPPAFRDRPSAQWRPGEGGHPAREWVDCARRHLATNASQVPLRSLEAWPLLPVRRGAAASDGEGGESGEGGEGNGGGGVGGGGGGGGSGGYADMLALPRHAARGER